MERPKLDINISKEDFRNYYWLKEELVLFCKSAGISSSGGKIEIANTIICFLETGHVNSNLSGMKRTSISNFDWRKEPLTLETLVTDNYSNTENVRQFFRETIGKQFKFNVEFMNWMKANVGKNLQDACNQWREIAVRKKSKSNETVIAPQYEYNAYVRDFMLDNPGLSTKDAIKYWKIKKGKSGPRKYQKEDI